MKKLLIIAVAIMLSSCNQSKVAYIDLEVLMKDYEATKALELSLKEKQELMAKELDSLSAPFQLKVQQYYQNQQKMSAQKRAEVEQSLSQEQQFLQSKQSQASQLLQEENQEMSEVLTKRVDSFVANYAKTKGFNMILGTSGKGTVLYGDEALNITSEILEILNLDYSKK
ncbi:MAG: OmpH family outer membrane protein [Lutibacter sp.]|uniref:OmpH family outer membrane protein n=1 Tax=Lutibacter sp. TaxID=1925666 RepID=UPI0017F63E24|nr:OmpH family outer membrane protein [Lutibacter sp.]MBT8317636.1 OmpH family outer membrane protein [Lutibacter sp.]NNJ58494.1 OmpH family outer membrane protein [Lutibacter sp.]